MTTLIDSIYDRLISIGFNPEWADAVSIGLKDCSYKKREAFYLLAINRTDKQIGEELGFSTRYANYLKNYFKKVLPEWL